MPQIICPVCDMSIKRSDYLKDIFKDDPICLEAANLVTHYRHAHLKKYDYAWRNRKDSKTGYAKMEHEDFRSEINNQAKKELAELLLEKGREKIVYGLLKLADNNAETNLFINNILTKGKTLQQNNKKKKF
jgi:hypothetical protein